MLLSTVNASALGAGPVELLKTAAVQTHEGAFAAGHGAAVSARWLLLGYERLPTVGDVLDVGAAVASQATQGPGHPVGPAGDDVGHNHAWRLEVAGDLSREPRKHVERFDVLWCQRQRDRAAVVSQRNDRSGHGGFPRTSLAKPKSFGNTTSYPPAPAPCR